MGRAATAASPSWLDSSHSERSRARKSAIWCVARVVKMRSCMRKLVIIALALPAEVHQSGPAQAGVTPIVVTTPALADPNVVFQR